MKFQMRKIHSVKLSFAGARTEKDEKCRNVAKFVEKLQENLVIIVASVHGEGTGSKHCDCPVDCRKGHGVDRGKVFFRRRVDF